jgi:protein TonB
MILEKFRYPFLGRMRRPEGVAPLIERDQSTDLGGTPATIFEGSLAISVFLVILLFLFFPTIRTSALSAPTPQEFVKFEDIENTRQLNRPPPPPRPAIPIEAPSDQVLEDVELTSSELNVEEDTAPPPPKTEEVEDEYFVAVEDMPEPVGGLEAIQRSVDYPEIARRAGVQGRVFVLAYVNEKGEVTKTEVSRGIGAGCDEAAAAAVRKAKFVPGRQRGKPVKVRVSIPVRFQLN